MFVCPNGDVFVDVIDITREHNDAQYICYALVGYIESVGQHCTICIDNVSNMRNATNLIIHHFPSLYFQDCVVNFLELLLED
jgi:hypothetical protein